MKHGSKDGRAPRNAPVTVDGRLTPEDIARVATSHYPVTLSRKAVEAIRTCRALIDRIAASQRPVYGVTTGVGELRNVFISSRDAMQLQQNIIRSHAAGVGDPFPEHVVRATMLLRAHTLARATPGCDPRW